MSGGRRLAFAAPLVGRTGEEHVPATYVVLPEEAAREVSAYELHQRIVTGRRRGFGSVKVAAMVGGSEWSTSLFPQTDGTWFLPVKSAVRRAEGLEQGARVQVVLDLA